MITVRDDDVLLPGSRQKDPLTRFIEVHEIIAEAGALHSLGVLCGEIQHYPGAIDYIREKLHAHEMDPQIHGWAHRPYHTFPTHRIVHHLNLCIDFFDEHWMLQPTKFYTPWGGDSPELREACEITGLELVDCSNILQVKTVRTHPKGWRGKGKTGDVTLFIHWWEYGTGRLRQALEILNDSTVLS
jgi:peptidoglycan/xylan/chitin deacetylase (PgdA/CDA1 family)